MTGLAIVSMSNTVPSKIPEKIAAIEEELFGSAAADYVRAAELDEKKNALEERLMEIYEELETSE